MESEDASEHDQMQEAKEIMYHVCRAFNCDIEFIQIELDRNCEKGIKANKELEVK